MVKWNYGHTIQVIVGIIAIILSRLQIINLVIFSIMIVIAFAIGVYVTFTEKEEPK